jgi:hypothetical protein
MLTTYIITDAGALLERTENLNQFILLKEELKRKDVPGV